MSKIPRWLELKAEADYWAWVIETMYQKAGQRSPLDRIIDDSTGHTQAILAEAKHAIAQFERCKRELATAPTSDGEPSLTSNPRSDTNPKDNPNV